MKSIRSGAIEDAFTEDALVDGVDDVEYDASGATIYTRPARSRASAKRCARRGLKIADAYLGMRAKTKVAPEGDELAEALAFLDALDEHEDVQRVFSNLDMSDVRWRPRLNRARRRRASDVVREVSPARLGLPDRAGVFVALVVWFGRRSTTFLLPPTDSVTMPSFVGQTLDRRECRDRSG